MSERQNGAEVALTGFPKIVPRHGVQQMVAFVGNATIGDPDHAIWVHLWIRDFIDNIATSTDADATATELAEALNVESLPFDKSTSVIIGAWEGVKNAYATLWEVSIERNTQRYRALRLLTEEQFFELTALRGAKPTETIVYVFSAGAFKPYVQWLQTEGCELISRFAGAPIPYDTVVGLEEYLRFAIRTAAGIYRVAGSLPVVAAPISTGLLFPTPRNSLIHWS
jgi:hypothetical protein